MDRSVLCATLCVLLCAGIVLSDGVELENKKPFSLVCNITVNSNVTWLKEGKPVAEIEGLMKRVKVETDGSKSTLRVGYADQKDVGNYTCRSDGKDVSYLVTSKLYVRVPDNVNVVEGEKLRLRCEVAGKNKPNLEWFFEDENNQNRTKLEDGDGDRIKIEKDTDTDNDNAILTIANITLNDRGLYVCVGKLEGVGNAVESKSMVRVKDKYAALWPFLGIVAEVVILCAIIFVYEKKHNKAELDESDTDQSPDQKNTPDHGKGNLRHRQ